jgi:hypothetical protein
VNDSYSVTLSFDLTGWANCLFHDAVKGEVASAKCHLGVYGQAEVTNSPGQVELGPTAKLTVITVSLSPA